MIYLYNNTYFYIQLTKCDIIIAIKSFIIGVLFIETNQIFMKDVFFMNNKIDLTFNIDEIKQKHISYLSFNTKKLDEAINNKKLKTHELNSLITKNWRTTSTEIRDFLSKYFGMDFDISYSSNRNRLNELIKKYKIHATKRGKKTTLDFEEYYRLITSDEFIKFVHINMLSKNKSENEDKMYEELMYLQLNKYKETYMYQEDKEKEYINIAYYFNLLQQGIIAKNKSTHQNIFDLSNIIKDIYIMSISDIELDNYYQDLINVANHRKQINNIYKFANEEDITNTNDEQIIKFFLNDIYRFENDIKK